MSWRTWRIWFPITRWLGSSPDARSSSRIPEAVRGFVKAIAEAMAIFKNDPESCEKGHEGTTQNRRPTR